MFDQSAGYYDALYHFKNYEQESSKIRDYIQNRRSNINSVLDVACGTGKHVEYLSPYYSVDGIDLNEEFVRIARDRNPASRFWCEDMTSFGLNKKYDVVICLFSSIAYVKTIDLVKRTVENFKRHLSESGLIIIEPWFTPAAWKPGNVSVLNYESDHYKISRMSYTEQDGDISILHFEYLVGSSTGLQHLKEKHELGLFHHDELINTFSSIGLNAEFDPQGISGRGIYILTEDKRGYK